MLDFRFEMKMPAVLNTINLGSIERIPLGEGREYEVFGKLIAVFRARDGRIYAVQARCPHRDGPLTDGIIGAGKVICPLHSYKFDLATGQPIGNDCEALKTYHVSISEDGEISVGLEAEGSGLEAPDNGASSASGLQPPAPMMPH
jgi:nitrite reductase (NADH) small subunit